MRILQVTNTYHPELQFGGPPAKIHALSRGLQRRGHDVRVVTFQSRNARARGVEMVEGIPVRYLPWTGWGLRQWPRSKKDLCTEVVQSEIVHCYGLYNFLCPATFSCARQNVRPCLLEPLGMYVPRARRQGIKRLYHRFFTFPMFRTAAAIVAASEMEKEELQAVAGDKLVLRRNGIDVELFQRLPAADRFRSQLQLPPQVRIILYIGRISPIKNLESLVRAFAMARLEAAVLVLVGPFMEAEYVARLRETISALGLSDRIRLMGPLYGDGKLAALAAAEVFVLPSLSESFGNAAAEAVAAGIPVLLTNTCGIASVIHRRAGLAVSLGEASLAEGLCLLMNREQRQPFIAEQQTVANELSWEEPLQQSERIYAEILQRAGSQKPA